MSHSDLYQGVHNYPLRLPIQLWNKLVSLADKDKRSVNKYIEVVLENHLNQTKTKSENEC